MDYKFLSETNLFRGLSEDDIKNVLPCLRPVERATIRTRLSLKEATLPIKSGWL